MMKIIRNPQVIWDVVDGVTTLYHLDSTEFYYINETGAVVWSVCDDTREEIIRQMRDRYPDQASCTIDGTVHDFLQALESANLILMQDEHLR
jgi:Coenzyme PQQ synthesis protein D (PqqD)